MTTTPLESILYSRLGITKSQLTVFCRRWHVAELALFGSVLTNKFQSNSDIDVLVTYQPEAKRGLIEKAIMKEELEELVGRKIDLISKKAIAQSRNWIRRKNILETAKVFYVA